MIITATLIEKACAMVEETSGKAIPFKLRGIKVDRYLITAALEIQRSELWDICFA